MSTTTVHERWCTQHVAAGPEVGPDGWCASETARHGVYVELVGDVDHVEGGVGVRINAATDNYLSAAQVVEVGADLLGRAVLAAGHTSLSATVVRNLAALIAARGALEVEHLEPLAHMFGVPVDRLASEDFDPTA